VNDEFLWGSLIIGNGMNTKFWEDNWLGNKPLGEQYQSLYNIFHHKNFTVENVLGFVNIDIGFK
jgi:hypothetical protein